ncbi:unnamed protein product [Caenorhabditis auriculariae]|uniref:Uncharacterized protein n=1 Tax=Caenorhabditis auriculariae TaxID=2777116 RepID=A0A8S1GR73_9PELO|nr:unnamed protein product [Caenorhabditis auriculariae]
MLRLKRVTPFAFRIDRSTFFVIITFSGALRPRASKLIFVNQQTLSPEQFFSRRLTTTNTITHLKSLKRLGSYRIHCWNSVADYHSTSDGKSLNVHYATNPSFHSSFGCSV